MPRFIVRFRGTGPKPAGDVERIRAVPETTVLDDSGRMLLVEASEEELKTLIESMPGWMMTREQMIPLPDPRPRPRHPPQRKGKGVKPPR